MAAVKAIPQIKQEHIFAGWFQIPHFETVFKRFMHSKEVYENR